LFFLTLTATHYAYLTFTRQNAVTETKRESAHYELQQCCTAAGNHHKTDFSHWYAAAIN